MEVEANEFASSLLMPAPDIIPYFRARRIDLALLAAMKPEWKVAMQALLMRATSLECLSKNQAKYLWKQISGTEIAPSRASRVRLPKGKANCDEVHRANAHRRNGLFTQ